MAAFRALEAYDPAANRWEVLPRMPAPRHGLAGVHLHSDSHDAFELAAR